MCPKLLIYVCGRQKCFSQIMQKLFDAIWKAFSIYAVFPGNIIQMSHVTRVCVCLCVAV